MRHSIQNRISENCDRQPLKKLILCCLLKETSHLFIIDFAVPGDSRIEEKEKREIEKYQDLRRELPKIWNVRVKIIPSVMGSLGAIPRHFGNRLKETGIIAEIGQVQKAVLLGTARILRRVLES